MKEFLIKKIEFTLFEVCIPDIGADPSGFGVWYEPGPGTPQKRFAVRIFTAVKILTANRFCGVPGPGSYQTPKPDGSAPMSGMQTSKRVNSIFLIRNSFMRIHY